MIYAQLKRSTVDSIAGETLLSAAARLETLGATIPKATSKALESLTERRKHIETVRTSGSPEQAAQAASKALAEGTGTITDVLNGASAKLLLDRQYGSTFHSIFEGALRLNSKEIHKELAALGDDWVTKILRPVVDKHVDFLTTAFNSTMQLEPMREQDQADFMLHTPGVAESWGELRALHSIANQFRRYQIIPASENRTEDEYEYQGEHRLTDHMKPTLTWFLWADQNGLRPGIYTETETRNQEADAA